MWLSTGVSKVSCLILTQAELLRTSPDVLKLGLLFETGVDVASVRELPIYLCFQHKLLQEYSGSYYVNRRLEHSPDVKVTSGGSRIFNKGSVDLVEGPWTPEVVTFRKFCMSKQKNLDPLGGVPSRSANGNSTV